MLGCAFDKESSFSFPLVSFAVFDEEEQSEEHAGGEVVERKEGQSSEE